MFRTPLERVADVVTDFQDHMPPPLARFGSVLMMFGALALVGTSFLH